MSTEQNKAIIRRLFLQSVNQGNLAVADELVSPRYTFHNPTQPLHGPEGWKAFVTMVRTGFPDFEMTIEDLLAEGDKVVVRMTGRGTHLGEFQGIAPTGRPVSGSGITICRLADGQVVDEWENYDELGVMQQIGAISSREAATA
jgi:predicted ester cyclase